MRRRPGGRGAPPSSPLSAPAGGCQSVAAGLWTGGWISRIFSPNPPTRPWAGNRSRTPTSWIPTTGDARVLLPRAPGSQRVPPPRAFRTPGRGGGVERGKLGLGAMVRGGRADGRRGCGARAGRGCAGKLPLLPAGLEHV